MTSVVGRVKDFVKCKMFSTGDDSDENPTMEWETSPPTNRGFAGSSEESRLVDDQSEV